MAFRARGVRMAKEKKNICVLIPKSDKARLELLLRSSREYSNINTALRAKIVESVSDYMPTGISYASMNKDIDMEQVATILDVDTIDKMNEMVSEQYKDRSIFIRELVKKLIQEMSDE